VAFSYARDEVGAQATCAACLASGQESRSYKASVLDTVATEAMVQELERTWGGIDVLVNNAGVSQVLPLALMDEDDWDRVVDINAKGTFLTSQAVMPGMIRRKGGVILNIGSLAGARMFDGPVHYCASKAAIKGLTQAMAKEMARYQIRVLCLAPGLLDEGMGRNVPEHGLADYLKHCALGRLGTLAEVARFAAFLVSDQNSYMNGETIIMDGGV
jgi:NAD(P)-dependent dehydrogenase (short-subunit alcohol dehydrogenase family)